MPLVAGVDSSTSGCKVEIRDADTGTLIATGSAPHPATTPPVSEQDPQAWKSAFDDACAQAGVRGRHRPAAIAVAAQQHGLVVAGYDGSVLRPAKLWNDTESAPDAEALLAALDGGSAGFATACGSVPTASFTITKLHWLQRQEPELFQQITAISLPHDWLTHQLTARHTTDRGDASGTGWWSPAENRYLYEVLALIDDTLPWSTMLPEVLGPQDVAGVWEEVGAVVAPGTGDNMAGALGLGLRPGDLALSLGTSGTAYGVSERPSADASGIVAGFADATGRFLPLVCTLNATKVTEAIRRLLGVTLSQFDALALDAAPGADGLVLVPHFDGERTPNRPNATGLLAGLRSDVSREQLARAAIEGVVHNLLDGADHLWIPAEGTPGGTPAAAPQGRLLLIGGGSHSSAFCQSVADLTGREVLVPEDREIVARGAAMQAATVLAGCTFEEVADAWELTTTSTEPNPNVDSVALRAAYHDNVDR